ncbi:serine/threonine-protein phosphatase, partial [Streptomyces sp. NPDC057545]
VVPGGARAGAPADAPAGPRRRPRGRWARRRPREVLDALRGDLENFSEGVRRDDIAVLALSRTPAGRRHRPPPVGQGARRAAETFGAPGA